MLKGRRPWQEELEIIDDTMKAISGVTDPEELVSRYWEGIDKLLPIHDYISVSRRNVEAPAYLITRSTRFAEHFNPWTQRDRLPKLTGGLMGEIAYANKPVFIDDLPARLSKDDPAWFYLQGFSSLIALPLGIFDNESHKEASVQLQEGDLLVLYTDGITETVAPHTTGNQRELFGTERLDQLLRTCADASPRVCLDRIHTELAIFSDNAPAADDRTLIAMRCVGP